MKKHVRCGLCDRWVVYDPLGVMLNIFLQLHPICSRCWDLAEVMVSIEEKFKEGKDPAR